MIKNPAMRRVLLNNQLPMRAALTQAPVRSFRQVNNLHEINWTVNAEVEQRTAKYLEATTRVYKPSQTIGFDRSGELLLFSCDNIKNSTIYFKYPYCLLDCLMPMSWYLFFINPFNMAWQFTLSFFYLANSFAWIPHALYWKSLDKKLHQMYLLKGGKYCRVVTQNPMGDQWYSWITIAEMHLLTEDREDFAIPAEEENFLKKNGQLKYEAAVEVEHYMDHAITVQDETLYFMKEGTVHQPEIFERVLMGFNIDTSDFTINTAHNVRFKEPNANY